MSDQPVWDDATKAQNIAARPDTSTWLSANAGSGKTRVLTDRVARLLLEQTDPQRILCLTYTKAAASEMQNRLFERLGQWAMMDDDALLPELQDLGITGSVTTDRLKLARTLFAQAIETPGGLKIQTIHSFCASLLRRFPIEAAVSPQFTEIDDRAAELLREEVLDSMASGPNAPLVHAFALHYTGDDIAGITGNIVSNKGLFTQELSLADVLKELGQPKDLDRTKLESQVFDGTEQALIQGILPALLAKGGNDGKAAQLLQSLSTFTLDALPILEKVFLYGKAAKAPFAAKIDDFPTKDTRKVIAHLLPDLNALMQRVEDARNARLALTTAERSHALHAFANHFVSLYEGKKQQRGWLDFDDLIEKTRALLNDQDKAAWVLFRIDGAIDHILVDEAQDTSRAQWDVIERLTDEFASGVGKRQIADRTLFVVGDKKQSIYSFQGADPREFDLKRDFFESTFINAQLLFQNRELKYSFRSSAAVLDAVDQVFDPRTNPQIVEKTDHIAFKDTMPGRVDLWPVVEKVKDDTKEHWHQPLDRKSPQHHNVILAERIAVQISKLLEKPHYIPDGKGNKRQITPGDFLILVQRRSDLFAEIIRACKKKGLAIAGSDRLRVGAELAVRDIAALLSFLATADDHLSLATALRSPLFGWSEQELFSLAHYRTRDSLWRTLYEQKDKHPKTVSILEDLRANVDFLRPFDLIERILIRHHGRQNLLARLGKEAEDGIDALLDQALAYERNDVPSLTGFLCWMETDDLTIKRQIDNASDQIRVMTVHGAKGLEAPIVILPDTAKGQDAIRDEILALGDIPIWKPGAEDMPDAVRARVDEMKKAQMEERQRLLYVAMTRAEKWLIVASAGDLPKEPISWYQMVEAGMAKLHTVQVSGGDFEFKRFQHGDWDALPMAKGQELVPKSQVLEPFFANPIKDSPPLAKSITPSRIKGAKALPGGEGWKEETAKAYGTLVHHLLEHLPSLDPDKRADAAKTLTQDADESLALLAQKEANSLLLEPDLAHLFHPDTLAEVPLTAELRGRPLYGVVDRLLVSDTKVTAVDFKTNRTVPDIPIDCPVGLLRQMGAYADALAQIYPDHQIQTTILWTSTATLMPLPHDLVRDALTNTPELDLVGNAS